MQRGFWRTAAVLSVLVAAQAVAADHTDAPATTQNKAADITDVYAWMDASGKVNLVLGFNPGAAQSAMPSDAVLYVFHVASKASFGAMTEETTQIICGFDSDARISCWAGDDEYVTGDASARAGITSQSGKMKVFSGRVNDPFFFNISGFRAVVSTVKMAAGGLQFDPAGCPSVDSATSTVLVTQLQQDDDMTEAKDDFAGQNLHAIVLQLDATVVNGGGPILAVWASTHQR